MFLHCTTVRGQPSWSEQCQALVIFSLLACPPLLSKGSSRSKQYFRFASGDNVPRFCRQWHHQPKKYLDNDDKDKTNWVGKDEAPIPRRADAPPTPLWRPPSRAKPLLYRHWVCTPCGLRQVSGAPKVGPLGPGSGRTLSRSMLFSWASNRHQCRAWVVYHYGSQTVWVRLAVQPLCWLQLLLQSYLRDQFWKMSHLLPLQLPMKKLLLVLFSFLNRKGDLSKYSVRINRKLI